MSSQQILSDVGNAISDIQLSIDTMLKNFGASLGDLWKAITQPFQALGAMIAQGFAWFGGLIYQGFKYVWDTFANIINGFYKTIEGFINYVRTIPDKIAKAVQDFISWVWSGFLWIINAIAYGIMWFLTNVYNYIIRPLVNTVFGFINAVLNALFGFINFIIDSINGFITFIVKRFRERIALILSVDGAMLGSKKLYESLGQEKDFRDVLNRFMHGMFYPIIGSVAGYILGSLLSSLVPSNITYIQIIPRIETANLPLLPQLQELPMFTEKFTPPMPPAPTTPFTQGLEFDFGADVLITDSKLIWTIPPIYDSTQISYADTLLFTQSLYNLNTRVDSSESVSSIQVSYSVSSMTNYGDSVSIA
jgi:hypothetical protein